MSAYENRLKRKLAAGHKSAGAWLQLANPLIAEIFGRAGFDWVMIDMEHGPGDIPDLIAQLAGPPGLRYGPAGACALE